VTGQNELLADADAAQAKAHEAYLANLRAYKKTDHQVTFGWFGGWTGESPASRCLYNLPDSTDFVSLWDGFSNLTPAQQADLKRAKEVKGIRALACEKVLHLHSLKSQRTRVRHGNNTTTTTGDGLMVMKLRSMRPLLSMQMLYVILLTSTTSTAST